MPLSITQCKSGVTIILDGQVFLVLTVHHVKPGKGGAFIRTRLKNLKLGTVLERTFKGNESLEKAFIEEKKLIYQYSSGNTHHFMDQENFDDSILTGEQLGHGLRYLKDDLEVTAYFHKNRLLNIVLPKFINFKVVETEPGIRGDTAKASLKPAKIGKNTTVSVPLFINVGDVIKVDTESDKYVERV